AQFAAPGADDRLRDQPAERDDSQPLLLAATDPASPYGAALPWPERASDDTVRPGRAAGARVILFEGQLIGYLSRTGKHLLTFLPDDSADRARLEAALVKALSGLATSERPAFLTKIDQLATTASPFARQLEAAGFVATSRGLLHRRREA